jgi:hypothetical protein
VFEVSVGAVPKSPARDARWVSPAKLPDLGLSSFARLTLALLRRGGRQRRARMRSASTT